jgi:hypothetical protein
VAANLKIAYFQREGFIEDQLENFSLAGFQFGAPFDPVFRVFHAEAPFRLITQYQVVLAAESDDIAVVDCHELRCIGDQPATPFTREMRGVLRYQVANKRSVVRLHGISLLYLL